MISPISVWWLKRESYSDFPFVVLAVILAGVGVFS